MEKNGSERKFGESVEWLRDAALAPKAENVVVPEIPLSANVREGWFKLYVSDIGLLSAMYGLETKRLLFARKLSGNAKGGAVREPAGLHPGAQGLSAPLLQDA